MTNIVERLRAAAIGQYVVGHSSLNEAADEIERLTAVWENEAIVTRELRAEIERLRAALKHIECVPGGRHTSGHLSECAWCKGSAEVARRALEGK